MTAATAKPEPKPETKSDTPKDDPTVMVTSDSWRLTQLVYGTKVRLDEEVIMRLDKVVPNPWELDEPTKQALNRLPEVIQRRIFGFIADNAGHFMIAPHSADAPAPGIGGPAMYMDKPAAKDVLQLPADFSKHLPDVTRQVLGAELSDEQLIRIAIYGLSKTSMFPKNREGWNELKKTISTADLGLMLVGAALVAEKDKASVGLARQLIDKDKFGLVLYAKASDFGIHRKPDSRLSLRLYNQDIDLNVGGFSSLDGAEKLSLEGAVSSHSVNDTVSKVVGGTVRLNLAGRYYAIHADPTISGKGMIYGEVAVDKPNFLGSETTNLSVSGACGIDNAHGGMQRLVAEIRDIDKRISLIASLTADSPTGKGTTVHGGLMLAGEWEPGFKEIELPAVVKTIRDDIEQTKKLRNEWVRVMYGGDEGKSELLRQQLIQAQVALKLHMKDYGPARSRYIRVRKPSDYDLSTVDLTEFEQRRVETELKELKEAF